MKVSIEAIDKTRSEQVIIQCHKVDARIDALTRYIKAMDGAVSGYSNDRMHQLFLQDIFYVEAVDNRLFAYTERQVYEVKMKLYEFEAIYQEDSFFRCSKAVVINLMKIESVHAILNGRLSARLFNGEEIIISRQYTKDLKAKLLGGVL